MTDEALRLGLDVGSTTVKAVVMRGHEMLFSDYRRHNADVRGEMKRLLLDIGEQFPDDTLKVAMTGSGGLGIARMMNVSFIQEVIAATEAIEELDPDVDVVIELGGEDAKITYLHPTPEQRMNGTCAGGTGAFIDQMASLLRTDAGGLDELAGRYENIYPIASRCGVFAKTDVQPLINQGARHEDIAASVFQAVATQTVAGLACGRPIRGKVIFLGGPLHFLPELREAFRRVLGEHVQDYVTPADGQLYVAVGAAFLADGPALSLRHLAEMLDGAGESTVASKTMRPLFLDEAERVEFNERHSVIDIEQADMSQAVGDLYLGIDAGSTTIKSVLIDDDGKIVHSSYDSNQGDPVKAAVAIARDVIAALPEGSTIARSCVTGYGEDLVRTALHADEGEIETMAHFRAAQVVCPGVTSVIDIGGQDMKFVRIREGVVDSIAVNEACSAGCGSFLQTFAETMGTDVRDFATVGMQAQAPVDLGSRCTVFMNSSVKQAQKEGAGMADISAGLSYSVVRNALYKVMKLRDTGELGDKVVAQGGTFLNNAVLRAFELLTGVKVKRPNISGHMGAYGAALIAKAHAAPGDVSAMMSRDLEGFSVESSQRICKLCQNHCKLTITTFDDGSRQVSGNRCERGASLDAKPRKSEIPNLYDYKYKRMFAYRRLTDKKVTRGEIGMPRALGMYEDYPLWFTIFTQLGFKVLISGRSNHDLFESGMESIASENVCYPAKLAHGHIEWLLDHGVKNIWMPCVSFERKEIAEADNSFNCPIVAFYPQVIEKNVERLREPGITFMAPFLNLNDPDKLAERLVDVLSGWDIGLPEMRAAVAAGFEELDKAKADIRAEGDRAMQYMIEHDMRGIVLAGRPYHVDPEINHGIPDQITQLGMVVLSEDALTNGMRSTGFNRPLRVRDQWVYHTRLYEAAAQVRANPRLNLVQLNSFGCGVDAVTTDQVQDILEQAGDIYTVLKIDEVSNLGAARIRLRSLRAASAEREEVSREVDTTIRPEQPDELITVPASATPPYTKQMRKTHTVYLPQMSPIHFQAIEPLFRRAGYTMELLEHATREDMECGLKYVNNDACFPAIMVIGQLINKFITGGADPDASVVAISQTGGMCRATNYVGMLRRGLKAAGYEQVPVLAVSAQGLESNPGFKLTPTLIHSAIQGLVLMDLLQEVLLRVRPYEREEGSAMRLYGRWNTLVREFMADPSFSPTEGRKLGFKWLCRQMVREFDELPLLDIPRKPRVGVVGEILVKFQPDANNNVIGVIEDEGCEAVMPGLMGFFLQSLETGQWRYENFGLDKTGRHVKKMLLWYIEQLQKTAHKALAGANGKFEVPERIHDMATRAQRVISLGTQAGEGWLLVAEMMHLIEHGTPNIICAQPFACLPNHVVGRGMFKTLRELYPQANITSIDYDPGASEVNQLNRIKLMIATAFKNEKTVGLRQWQSDFDTASPLDAASPASPDIRVDDGSSVGSRV
ncbi:acyl-CoA dehydratase activase-related protein [Propionibacterium australiense]|uniref:Activase n=1 Tax=Propionibacterium australiense TaxID=119981 RepID=A0A383S6W8_9ACTN|nr:acyl-CoA dehydratase activase-related protein [Propionibacterium australiense]RLP07139.1 activase [Propionibacterium australiense]RLP07907.1 activase [Propionibacterium australiense]SYZ33755.1 FldB/FldC dehydratase alpha/beta subunit [Propionibacterium australiense]VEH88732.1 2-hydroxyglutaryl-CoA dehydratase component A [Propionibacterium australiense]